MSRPHANELPPTTTIEPVAAPPPSDAPTVAQLKADINSGNTGDKNPVFDPGLSPLGTDDEAAGHPPSAARVALARYHERFERWIGRNRQASAAHAKRDGIPVAFTIIVAAICIALVGGVWFARRSSHTRINTAQAWQEWRDSNPQPPVLETGALAS